MLLIQEITKIHLWHILLYFILLLYQCTVSQKYIFWCFKFVTNDIDIIILSLIVVFLNFFNNKNHFRRFDIAYKTCCGIFPHQLFVWHFGRSFLQFVSITKL